jgi:hypothetical protein
MLKRILVLGASAILVMAIVAPTLASVPGERMVSIKLASNVETGAQTFSASGPGVCSGGWADDEILQFIEFGESLKLRLTKWLHCDDGSGTFQILLSAGAPTGSPALSGGWVIIDGTGVYERAVGGGTMSAKWRYPFDEVVFDSMTGAITR